MLNLRQLECAIALTDHGQFQKAANAVGITQSGLTQNIQRLEGHYGQALFTRERQGVALTQYGEIVIEGARAVIDRLSAVEREINLVSNLQTGQLLVGADPILANAVLGPALYALITSHPHLRFSTQSGSRAELESLLKRRELDLFISFPTQKEDPLLTSKISMVTAPVAVGAPNHPITRLKKPKLTDFLAYPLVSGPLPEWYFAWAKEQLEKEQSNSNFIEPYVLQTDDVRLLKNIALHSDALMALMRSDVERELQNNELVELQIPNWPTAIPVAIVVPADRPLPPAAQRLFDEIETVLRELAPP